MPARFTTGDTYCSVVSKSIIYQFYTNDNNNNNANETRNMCNSKVDSTESYLSGAQ